ncbi:MAG: ATP-binding protein [Fimbriimonas sp.]|nr:ATP-binding protein [Fimbriimonas sp.]
MRTSHRARLALTISAVSGAVLAGLFLLSIVVFRREEVNRAHDILRPAILQVEHDAETQDSISPDLGIVVEANPQLSFGTFDLKGNLVASEGAISLEPSFRWAVSMIGKKTNRSGVQWGEIEIGNVTVIAGSKSVRGGLLIGVLPFDEREKTISRAALALALLWFPLVGLIGAVTWLASERTFKPLSLMAQQAELFSESDLTRRLDVPMSDEFGAFAARLNSFLDRLEDSVQRQKRFVEDAAHELRTPLTILRGRIETTLMINRSDEEYRDALYQALRETERMSRLVEAMLQSALPVADVTTPVDIELALEKVEARWLDRFVESAVFLAVETIPAQTIALEEEVDCVIDNLVSNALRSSPQGSTCTLAMEIDDSFVLVSVTDEGKGVPADKRDAIFERFTRLERSRNRSLGGFGVGLAVSKRLVEARGGTIRVTDGPTGGARFEVRWPAVMVPR